MPGEPTPGELGRRLDDLRGDLRHIADRLDQLPSSQDLTAVSHAWTTALTAAESRLDSRVGELGRRVDGLEAWQTWALRLVVGIIVTGALAAGIAYGGRL